MSMNFVELFAGAGGLSEGFLEANWKPIAFIEKDKYCCETIKTRLVFNQLKQQNNLEVYRKYLKKEITRDELWNYDKLNYTKSVFNKEINEQTTKELVARLKDKKIDLLLGGPPCQAYSIIGRAQNKKKQNDERLYLYKYYLKFLKKIKPTSFLFENVPGLLSIQGGTLFKSIIKDFESLGYKVNYEILDSSNYGVLQSRKRIIVVGNLNKQILFRKKQREDNFCVKYLLEDLSCLKPNQEVNKYKTNKINKYLKENHLRKKGDVLTLHKARPHNQKDLKIYKKVINSWDKNKRRLKYKDLPKNLKTHKNASSFLDRFKVVAQDLPSSHTMVAHVAKDGHHYIHPDINQCRSLSVREVARIQSFPDNFYFEGPRTAQFTQIGNAVPPLLSKFLCEQIIKSI